MEILFNLYPNGKKKAFTASFDDGTLQDRTLINILDSYGIKATFNVNSGLFGTTDSIIYQGRVIDHSHVNAAEVKQLYKNHEVAVHTLTHPSLDTLSNQRIKSELQDDKKNIEELVGYPVRGMAYPFGVYNQTIINQVSSVGLDYARTIESYGSFVPPTADEYYKWQPTCVLWYDIMDYANNFINSTGSMEMPLFAAWGHSYAFDMYEYWDTLKTFCSYLSNKPDIWYASNIEVIDYLKAVRGLKFSVTGSSVYNPSGVTVWFTVNGSAVSVSPGSTVKL